MYEVTLKGNYNVPVNDLGLEFGPVVRTRLLSDEDFDSSADLKRFLGRYLDARKLDDGAPASSSNLRASR